MKQDWFSSLDQYQLDAFKEITNIGAGNAATALAEMLSDRVTMSVPCLEILDINGMASILGGPENEVAGVLLRMYGDVDGMIMFILDKQFCHTLLSVLLNKHIQSFEEIDDMDLSVFQEMGNIIVGGYANALAMMLDMEIKISTPEIAIDMAGAILSYPAQYFGTMGDKVMFVKEDFQSDTATVTSHLLIMPQPESFDNIMKKLGVMYE